MENNLQTALILMVVGMITVFVILWSVILLSRILINLTNRWEKKRAEVITLDVKPIQEPLNHEHVAAISATISHLTGGSALITRIEKKEVV